MTINEQIIKTKWVYILLILTAFVLYGNTIKNKYSIDDDYVTTQSGFIQQGIAGIPSIITKPYAEINGVILDYRPIVQITYAIEYQFFQQNPYVSHFMNVLFFAICLIILFNFLRKTLVLDEINSTIPLIITMIFAIHPIHTEVVNSLKNRDELLSLLFGLLFMQYGFAAFNTSDKKIKNSILAIVFLILSLLSKIVGILYFPILLLLLFFYKKEKWKVGQIVLLILFIYIVLQNAINTLHPTNRVTSFYENPLSAKTTFPVYAASVLKIIFYHIKMLLIPHPLRFYYGFNMFPISSVTEPTVLISFIVYLGLTISGFWLFFKKDILGFFILAFLGCTLFYSNFPIPYTGIFSERALLNSSIWFIGFLVILTYKIITKYQLQKNNVFKKIFLVLVACISFVYAYLTITRNFCWKDTLTLASHDIEYSENSAFANYFYANNLIKESLNTTDTLLIKEYQKKALPYYQQAINIYPYSADFNISLANLYFYTFKSRNKAERLYRNALMIDSTKFSANFSMARMYMTRQEFEKSIYYFERAYRRNPKDSLTLFLYAQNADLLGKLDLSYKLNKELLEQYPNLTYPYMNLGVYYSKKLQDDTAVVYFEKAIELGERSPQLLNQLVIYYNGKNNKEKAAYFSGLLQKK